MSRKRRGFDASFKLHVVQMVKEQGLSIPLKKQNVSSGTPGPRAGLDCSDLPGYGLAKRRFVVGFNSTKQSYPGSLG